MDGLRYRQHPGAAWLVLVRGTRVVLLPAETSQERLDGVWASLQGSAPVEEVFDAVTGGLAGSLSRLPSFGLVSVDSQVTVLLRGPLELDIDGVPAASGSNLRTWSEQVFPASGRLVLRPAGSQGQEPASPLLQLREGMAPVQGIEIDLAPAPAPASSRPAAAGHGDAASVDIPPVPAEPPPAPSEPVPAELPAAAGPAPVPAEPDAAEPDTAEPEPAEPAPAAGPDLSAAVPWLNLTPPPLSPDAAALTQETEAAPDGGEPTETLPPMDHDGNTVMGFRPQPGTAVPGTPLPGTPSPDPGTAEAAEAPEEYDDETIRSAPAGPRPASASAGTAPGPDTGPTVLARTCSQGHVNPPTAAACRFCGAELSGDPQPEARPSLGLMRLSTGAVYELDRNIIIGRQPSASRVAGAQLPRMVQVPSDSGDISRSHAEVRLEGWHVMLRDLFSTNGTVLIREGALPRRLAQGETAILLDGDVAELGDGVTLRFEGLA
ncbi:FHA domain-containing protein [Arthrobacter gandavensis]|uniref:FHA domain-containing protein n=1 Tax=Arthrobacter gandavensis TaxID=169960 RepID=UPI00188FBC94|nr:FHA domain-containing protein [Arthrobacter gandavensis]MBF4992951.1 FHA domain-containing protein [Arthrobacter gandavensis]